MINSPPKRAQETEERLFCRFRSLIIAAGLVTVSVGCASDPATREQTRAPNDGAALFAQLARGSNYIPLALPEMTDKSALIAVGHLIDVDRGLTIVHETNGEPARSETIVIHFKPDRVLKGNDATTYLEFAVGPIPDIESLRSNLPDQALAAFAIEIEHTPMDGVTLENDGAGHPPDTALHRLTTPQGLIQEGSGSLTQPLEMRGMQLFDDTATSFEEMIAEIEMNL